MKNNMVFTSIPISKEMLTKTDETSFILRPSLIADGVGVFVTHGVKKGTLLSLFPDMGTRVMTYESYLKLSCRSQKFLDVFGVSMENGFSYPSSFSQMSIGWYLNHSFEPNAHHDEQYNYYALRDIEGGEEVVINYQSL